MDTVLDALKRALHDLPTPRVLAVLVAPPLAALGAWAALAWFYSDDWARWIAERIATSAWLQWIGGLGLSGIFVWASGIAALAVLLPVVFVVAVLVAEAIAMPVVVPWIASRRFAGLEARKGGTVAGSILNAAIAVPVFVLLWIVTLPLWFTGVGALALPALLSAWLNQRLFRYDALADHASAEEFRRILAGAGARLYLLGLLLALLYYVPIVNLAAPVVSALAFTHFCLAELDRLRREETRGV
ncbi:MAG: EI24 domain-containing protein [Burkholderiales bacterium]|nr:EI24 domain-containing protein [Burkholderiales bacterium]